MLFFLLSLKSYSLRKFLTKPALIPNARENATVIATISTMKPSPSKPAATNFGIILTILPILAMKIIIPKILIEYSPFIIMFLLLATTS